MEVEDIEKTVLAYLKGKGYRLAELGLQEEKTDVVLPVFLVAWSCKVSRTGQFALISFSFRVIGD